MGILAAGIVGLGAVWGWLIAQRTGASRHPGSSLLAITLATLLLAAQVLWLADVWMVMPLLGGAGLSFLAHFLWVFTVKARFRAN
jgi:F0F1-type ATP synthase assembly protein I